MKWYKVCNRISLLLHALCSALGYFLIEMISRRSFSAAWTYMTTKPLVFAYNAALIFTTSLIVYLFRRRCFWRVLISILWLLLGIINGVILSNRVTPFTGPDLHLLTDGMAVLNKYLPAWGVVLALILLGLFALLLLILLIKAPKYKRKVKFRYDLLLVVVGAALFAGATQLALEKRVLSNYFGNIAFAYEDYGYPYCLAVTIFDTGISCPRDYSEQEITRIERTEDNLPATNEDSKPNIIFVQLESFFDPTLVRGQSYYTGTIFEVTMDEFGGSVAGGGRYDKMIGKFTGQDTPACGFSIGFERIVMLLLENGYEIPSKRQKKAYLLEKNMHKEGILKVLEMAKADRAAGKQVLVVNMKKNKKFQKDQLIAEGYEDITDCYKDSVMDL